MDEKCIKCGNCCRRQGSRFWFQAFKVKNETPPDKLRELVEAIRDENPDGLVDDWQDCELLDEYGKCIIYHDRPQLCREFEAGSDTCRIFRRDGKL